MRVKCEQCGVSKDVAFMVRMVRNNEEKHICREHTVKLRRVHGGRVVPVKRAG